MGNKKWKQILGILCYVLAVCCLFGYLAKRNIVLLLLGVAFLSFGSVFTISGIER